MTNYTKTTDFAAKDSLPSGNAAKIVKGSEIDTEFNNIATASATKANANDAVLTGTTTAQTLDISGNVDVDGTLETDALSLNGVTVTSTAAELNYVDGVTSAIQTQLDAKAALSGANFTGSIDVTGSVTADGAVIQGTGSQALTVSSSTGNSVASFTSTDSQAYISYLDDATTGVNYVATGAQGNDLVLLSGAGVRSKLLANGDFQLYEDTASTPKFFWDASAESLGIGTSSPSVALDVQAASGASRINVGTGGVAGNHGVNVVSGGANNDYGVFFNGSMALGSNTTTGTQLKIGSNGSETTFQTLTLHTNASERMRIDSSGNLALGTSSVTNALGWGSVAQVGGANPALSLKNTSNVQWDIANFGDTFNIYNGSNSRLKIDSSGNLLVGRTSASYSGVDLHVGNTSDSQNGIQIQTSTTGYGYVLFGDGTGADAYRGQITYKQGDDYMSLHTAGGERMRIDSAGDLTVKGGRIFVNESDNGNTAVAITRDADEGYVNLYSSGTQTVEIRGNGNSYFNGGNVGIGTASPDSYLAEGSNLVIADSGHAGITLASGTTSEGGIFFADGTSGSDRFRGMIRYNHTSNYMEFRTDAGERMRIDSSGNLLVGRTTAGSGTGFEANTAFGSYILSSSTSIAAVFDRLSSDGAVVQFRKDGSPVGSISVTSSATAYNTSSDQRLKENIADADDAGSKVDAIQVRQFDWIADGSHQDYGMVAQELQSVAPEAVTGDGDSDEMMGVDYSKLVPMLVKEIQSLRARVQQLEND